MGVYGDEEFIRKFREEVDEQDNPLSLQSDELSILLDEILDVSCDHLSISLKDVCSDKRSKQVIQVRSLMALLTKRLVKQSLSALGRKISKDPTSLARLARKAEQNVDICNMVDELQLQFSHFFT